MSDAVCRFVAVEATIHWAHDEVILDFRIPPPAGDRLTITATLAYWGNYWDCWKEPRTATLALPATIDRARSTQHSLTVTIDPPAPITTLTLDLTTPVVNYIFGFGMDNDPLPPFFAPMITWARTQGIDFYDLPAGMTI